MEKEDQEFKAGLHTHMNPPTHTHHTNTQHIVLPPKKKNSSSEPMAQLVKARAQGNRSR